MSTSISEHARQEEEVLSCWACGNQNPPRPDGSCRHCNEPFPYPSSSVIPPVETAAKEAARNEIDAFGKRMSGIGQQPPQGYHVQQAIDAAIAAKEREIRDLTLQRDSMLFQLRDINGCLDWGRIANGATTLSEVQRTIHELRESQHGREQDRIKHEMERDALQARVRELESYETNYHSLQVRLTELENQLIQKFKP